jgi:hypothetical protein
VLLGGFVAVSGCHHGQLDSLIIALNRPLVILLEQQGTDKADHGGLVGEDADDLAASLDLAIEAFERIGGVQLDAMLGGEAHVGQDVGLGIVHQGGKLGDAGPELIGDLPPLLAGGFGVVLGEGGADPGLDDPALGLAGMGALTH